jgi:hypothetical protein
MKEKTIDSAAGIPRTFGHDLRERKEHTLVFEIKRGQARTPSEELAWKEIWKTLLNDSSRKKNSNN